MADLPFDINEYRADPSRLRASASGGVAKWSFDTPDGLCVQWLDHGRDFYEPREFHWLRLAPPSPRRVTVRMIRCNDGWPLQPFMPLGSRPPADFEWASDPVEIEIYPRAK